MPSTRVAAVQAEPVWFDLAATTQKTIALIAQAAEEEAHLVAFPETWLPGYPGFIWSQSVIEQLPMIVHYRANSAELHGPEIAAIRDAAAEHRIMVVLGFSERDHGSLYMSQLIIGPDGAILVHRRKIKPTHVERAVFGESDGSGLQVVETALGRVGALNCWEHMQPLVKFAMYAQHEQIHVAGWPALAALADSPLPQLSGQACLTLSRTYALEGGVFVIVPKQMVTGAAPADLSPDGTPNSDSTALSAVVFGPDGTIVSTPLDPGTEGLAFADIDLAGVSLAKAFADPVGHYARPDVFRISIDRSARSVANLDGLEATLDPLMPVVDDDVLSA